MSQECGPKPGTFCWTELMTRDVAAARVFYQKLVGWQFQEHNVTGLPYTIIAPPGSEESIGGMMQMTGPQFEGVPPHWMPYIATDDVDAIARRTTELGGTVRVPPTDIPNVGRFCVIADPTGAVISFYQAAEA